MLQLENFYIAGNQNRLSGKAKQTSLQFGKSQTLPRNMGSKSQPNIAGAVNRPNKPTPTTPAIKRQLSVSSEFYKLFQYFLKLCYQINSQKF